MKSILAFVGQAAAILLLSACNKDDHSLQEPELLWNRPYSSDQLPELIYSDDMRVYSFSHGPGGGLLAHNKLNGDLIWKSDISQFQGVPKAGLFGDDVFVLHSYDVGNHFYGVDLHTGQYLWEKYFPGTAPYSMKGKFGDTFFFCDNDGQPGQFRQLNAHTGDIRPLQAFSYPSPWTSGSPIFGRVDAAGDTILYQLRHVDTGTPQYLLSAWNRTANSPLKEIALTPLPSWIQTERLLFEEQSSTLLVRDSDGIAGFDAETLTKRWSIAENTVFAVGEWLLAGDLLLHEKINTNPQQIEVLDAANGAVQFSFESNSSTISNKTARLGPAFESNSPTLSNKTARLGPVIYHFNDPQFDLFGLVKNARLQAFQNPGGALRWDETLTLERGGEDFGVVYCDVADKAVFVFSHKTLFLYKPVK